jgi:hypothetical protein
MEDVQEVNNCINIPLSQTFCFYLHITVAVTYIWLVSQVKQDADYYFMVNYTVFIELSILKVTYNGAESLMCYDTS